MNENQVTEQIGQRLLEARNALGLSQEKAAALLDVHRNILHEWEAGKRLATMKDLRKAAEIYDRSKLRRGDVIPGPAIVIEMDATTLIETGCVGTVDAVGNILINLA